MHRLLADDGFTDPAVAAIFGSYPATVRGPLLAVRALILATAAQTPGVGAVVETLKWGQPAYLPAQPHIGTTIRIDRLKTDAAGYAVFFHCQTRLVDDFRKIFRETFAFEGNRAILLSAREAVDEAALCHCFELALTYHLRRRAK